MSEVKEPFYKGRGNHSINELEGICLQYKEYSYHERLMNQHNDLAIAAKDQEIAELESQLKVAVKALEEIANDKEESSHERAENALWTAKSTLKKLTGEKPE